MITSVYFVLAAVAVVTCHPTFYDQRQSGKTNVRVEVKDAVIIAVGDGEFGGDYDYSYDYSDLTVKPDQMTPPTKKPSSTTTPKTTTSATSPASFNITQNAAVVLEAENNSIIFPANRPGNGTSEPIKIPANSFKPDQIPVVVLQEVHGNRPNKFLPVKTVNRNYLSSSQIRGKATNGTEELPVRLCSPGFYLDSRNRCRRIRRPMRERPQLRESIFKGST